jgi:hypothetical protein
MTTAPTHIVVVTLENENFSDIVGNPDAPYLNRLISEGMLFTSYDGLAHPSQPNYIGLFSGSLHGARPVSFLPPQAANFSRRAQSRFSPGPTAEMSRALDALQTPIPWPRSNNRRGTLAIRMLSLGIGRPTLKGEPHG